MKKGEKEGKRKEKRKRRKRERKKSPQNPLKNHTQLTLFILEGSP
jgi:hypothetical protein